MKIPQHKLEGEKSIFVRFRHGFKLFVKNNIKEKLQIVIAELKKNPDHDAVFKNLIKDMREFSMLGVHPDSTWFCTVKEIFDGYEMYREKIDEETKSAVIELLDIISKAKNIEDDWDKIKKHIERHIEVLSGWKRLKANRLHVLISDIKRDKDGKYYMIENGERIDVIGAKTQGEEKFDYIVNDATSKYGRLGNIFHLIGLIAIGEQYAAHPEHFSERVVCSLHDDDYNTYYLHWSWYVWGLFDFIPVFWRPRSCFCDPQWVAFDFLTKFSEGQQMQKDFPTQLTNKNDEQKFQKAFSGYPLQYELALDTNVYFGNEAEVYFDFEGRAIRWINGTRFAMPTLIVPCNNSDYTDGRTIAKKFLSIVVKETNMAVVEVFSTAEGIRFNPMIRQPRVIGGLNLDPRYLQREDTSKYSEKKWIGLALYKEGVNAKSIYYSFLSFYKIIELAQESDIKKIKEWIENNIDKATALHQNWKTATLKNGQSAGNYLYGSGRCAVAHVESEKGKINNPDNLEDFSRIQNDLPIIKALAEEILFQNLL